MLRAPSSNLTQAILFKEYIPGFSYYVPQLSSFFFFLFASSPFFDLILWSLSFCFYMRSILLRFAIFIIQSFTPFSSFSLFSRRFLAKALLTLAFPLILRGLIERGGKIYVCFFHFLFLFFFFLFFYINASNCASFCYFKTQPRDFVGHTWGFMASILASRFFLCVA